MVLCSGEIISKDMIPEYILESMKSNNRMELFNEKHNEQVGLREALKSYEHYLISKALEEEKGNIVKAANKLKIPRSTLHYKLDNYNNKLKA